MTRLYNFVLGNLKHFSNHGVSFRSKYFSLTLQASNHQIKREHREEIQEKPMSQVMRYRQQRMCY